MIGKKTEFEQLHSYVEESSGNEKNICEITAIKNGIIVYENYWHGYRRGDALNIMSVTKSVMSLLIGIAVDKGLINSIFEMAVVLNYRLFSILNCIISLK